jgi:hypothetical protein
LTIVLHVATIAKNWCFVAEMQRRVRFASDDFDWLGFDLRAFLGSNYSHTIVRGVFFEQWCFCNIQVGCAANCWIFKEYNKWFNPWMLHRNGCVVGNGGCHLLHLYPSFQSQLHCIWFSRVWIPYKVVQERFTITYNKLQQHVKHSDWLLLTNSHNYVHVLHLLNIDDISNKKRFALN